MTALPDVSEVKRALAEGDGTGVAVALLDSGVEVPHPGLPGLQLSDDLALLIDDLGVVARPGEGIDVYGHGTAVAARVLEVAPRCRIGSFRVLDQRLGAYTAQVSEAARCAIASGYRIINCSFGCAAELAFIMPFKEWIDTSYVDRIHVVAACSNADFALKEWPAHFTSVISVSANAEPVSGVFAHVPGGSLVEFSAPAHEVRVPWRNGQTRVVGGSSFAAPVVAGYLARLLSVFPDLTPDEAKSALRRAAIRPSGARTLPEYQSPTRRDARQTT